MRGQVRSPKLRLTLRTRLDSAKDVNCVLNHLDCEVCSSGLHGGSKLPIAHVVLVFAGTNLLLLTRVEEGHQIKLLHRVEPSLSLGLTTEEQE